MAEQERKTEISVSEYHALWGIAALAEEVREKQRVYYRTQNQPALAEAKAAEKRLDQALENLRDGVHTLAAQYRQLAFGEVIPRGSR
jgi:hypothetical protein